MNCQSRRALSAISFVLAALLVAPALANEGDEADAPGEVFIKTNAEFVRFTVNGKRNWENHHYENRNKTLVIRGLSRDEQTVIELMPRGDGLQPQTVTLNEGDYKRKRVRRDRRRVIVFMATKKVKFTKDKPKPSQPKAAPKKAADKAAKPAKPAPAPKSAPAPAPKKGGKAAPRKPADEAKKK